MTEPWELTPAEFEQLQHFEEPSNQSIGYERNIALAAQKKLLDYLSSQVGPDSCEKCRHHTACPYEYDAESCKLYCKYLGQQQGYAKGYKAAIHEVKSTHGCLSVSRNATIASCSTKSGRLYALASSGESYSLRRWQSC